MVALDLLQLLLPRLIRITSARLPHSLPVYEVGDKPLTPVALAYLRARNADPMCRFVSWFCSNAGTCCGEYSIPCAGGTTTV